MLLPRWHGLVPTVNLNLSPIMWPPHNNNSWSGTVERYLVTRLPVRKYLTAGRRTHRRSMCPVMCGFVSFLRCVIVTPPSGGNTSWPSAFFYHCQSWIVGRSGRTMLTIFWGFVGFDPNNGAWEIEDNYLILSVHSYISFRSRKQAKQKQIIEYGFVVNYSKSHYRWA